MSKSAITKLTMLQQMKTIRRAGLEADFTAGVPFNIFQVQGNAILLVNIFGICTTLIAGAIVPQFSFTPTGGAAVAMAAAMASLNTNVPGTIYVWDGVTVTIPAPAAAIGWGDSAEAGWNGDYGILPVGIVQIVNAITSTGGVIDWYMNYLPCSPASQVIAL